MLNDIIWYCIDIKQKVNKMSYLKYFETAEEAHQTLKSMNVYGWQDAVIQRIEKDENGDDEGYIIRVGDEDMSPKYLRSDGYIN